MEEIKHQAIIIKGGTVFENKNEFYDYLKRAEYNPYEPARKKWTDWLTWSLSKEVDVFIPPMPNKRWADYKAWEIWFEKLFDYISPENSSKLVLIGQSLGAAFLLKYLANKNMPKRIAQLHLISSPVKDNDETGEKLVDFKPDLTKLNEIEKQTDAIFLYHSKDDHVVPFEHSLLLKKRLKNAKLFEFEDRGHFYTEPVFIELLDNILQNVSTN